MEAAADGDVHGVFVPLEMTPVSRDERTPRPLATRPYPFHMPLEEHNENKVLRHRYTYALSCVHVCNYEDVGHANTRVTRVFTKNVLTLVPNNLGYRSLLRVW